MAPSSSDYICRMSFKVGGIWWDVGGGKPFTAFAEDNVTGAIRPSKRRNAVLPKAKGLKLGKVGLKFNRG